MKQEDKFLTILKKVYPTQDLTSEITLFKDFISSNLSETKNQKIIAILNQAFLKLLEKEYILSPEQVEWLEVYMDNMRDEPTHEMIGWVIDHANNLISNIFSEITI